MIKSVKYILLFCLSVLIQVLLFDRIHFFGLFNVSFYVLFILLLGIELNKSLVMLLTFVLGFTIDIFASTPGINAAATVLIGFLRPFILQIYSPREGYEINKIPSIANYGFFWFFKYALTMIFIHRIALAFIDAFTFANFLFTMLKIVVGTLATLLFVIFGHLLFMKK